MNLGQSNELIGQFIARIKLSDAEEKEEALREYLDFIHACAYDQTDSINEFEQELKEAGLFDKRKQQLTFLRESVGEIPTLNTAKLEPFLFTISRMVDIEASLVCELLEKKSHDLFSEYL